MNILEIIFKILINWAFEIVELKRNYDQLNGWKDQKDAFTNYLQQQYYSVNEPPTVDREHENFFDLVQDRIWWSKVCHSLCVNPRHTLEVVKQTKLINKIIVFEYIQFWIK